MSRLKVKISTMQNWLKISLIAIILCPVLLLLESCTKGSKITLFSDIIASNAQEYNNYLMKLTYMGPQDASVNSLVFGSAPLSISQFKAYERAGFNYTNDGLSDFAQFSASGSEMESIINALNNSVIYKDGSNKNLPILSFMIMRDVGGQNEKVFETLVEDPNAVPLIRDFLIPNLEVTNIHGRELCTFWLKNVGG